MPPSHVCEALQTKRASLFPPHLLWLHEAAGQLLAEHEVAVHGFHHDACYVRVLELEERVVLGLAGLLVAGQAHACDLAELGEVACVSSNAERSW